MKAREISLRRLVICLLAPLCLAAPLAAGATERIHGNAARLDAARTIDDDLLIAGSSVAVLGKVNGDVTAAGANVTISGPVKDDILAAGGTIEISGPVLQDVRAAGGTITLSGPIQHNLTLFGGSIDLKKSAKVGRDASIAGGTVQIEAPINRNLDLSAGEVRLGSEVGGKVTMQGDKLILLPGARIAGDIDYYGPAKPVIQPGATVIGKVNFHPVAASQPAAPQFTWPRDWLYRFLAFTLIGLLLVAIAPVWLPRVGETAAHRTGLSLLVGFLTLVAVPMLCIGMFISLVGIPLAIGVGLVFVTIVLLSGTFVAYPLGDWVLRMFHRPDASPYMRMTVGVLLVSLLVTAPVVGWLFQALAVALGTGAFVLERYSAGSRGGFRQPVASPPTTFAPGPA
jgi:hypothetical protein